MRDCVDGTDINDISTSSAAFPVYETGGEESSASLVSASTI
jgi:hypothetical protein